MAGDAHSSPERCTNCQSVLPFPVMCTGCRTLYPPMQAMDYFTLLGLEREYDLDESTLDARAREITRSIHPDRFSSASDEVRNLATRISADVNNALNVLRDPVRRAAYLLDLVGGPSGQDERGVPGDLLAEVMSWREEILDAQTEKDEAAQQRLREEIKQAQAAMLASLQPLASRMSDLSEEDRRTLRLKINAMKYYDNLLRELAPDPFAKTGGAS